MTDYDGKPGGLTPDSECSGQFDDTAASLSTFASLASDAAHTLAAPVVCITSTYLNGLGLPHQGAKVMPVRQQDRVANPLGRQGRAVARYPTIENSPKRRTIRARKRSRTDAKLA